MDTPTVVWVRLGEGTAAKGIVASVVGLDIDVSLLDGAANQFNKIRNASVGNRASIVFHSNEYGDTPPIGGVIKGAFHEQKLHRFTVEITDWNELAIFWQSVLYKDSRKKRAPH